MKTAIFSVKEYDRYFLAEANTADDSVGKHELVFFNVRLSPETVSLASGYPSVCVFVNDRLDESVLRILADGGTRLIALRCAGFNNVDLAVARELGLTVVRVPDYSPNAVAEHTVGLMLALNRNLHRAYNRVREGNFALEGLLGFDFCNRVVGVIGTGKIGQVVCRIMTGFGCRIIAYDKHENSDCISNGVQYVSLGELLTEADVITLHCPLTAETHHMIDADVIQQMKAGVMLINTSRGGIIDTQAVIGGLKQARIGSLGIDVYEEEADLFYEDLSSVVLRDDQFARLLTFPNVIVTGHQAFFTSDALQQIAKTTIANISSFEESGGCVNAV